MLDQETEVLTKSGWRTFDQVSYDNQMATINQETNELEYQNPTGLVKKEYEGRMYKISESQQIDLLVTPNHSLYVNTGDRRYGEFELEKAENVKGRQMAWKKDCNWNGEERDCFYVPGVETVKWHNHLEKDIEIDMDNWIEFLGYFLADGHATRTRSGQVNIACREDNEMRETEKKCLEKMPFKFTSTKNSYLIYDKRLLEYLRRFGLADTKYVPKEIKQLSSEQLEILLQAFLNTDGSRNHYYTVSEKLRDDVMEIALKTGRSANWTVKHEEGAEGNLGTANHDLYTIAIQNEQTTPEINYKDYGARDEWTNYNGFVYAVDVPNDTMMVRRNGKTCWTGGNDYE